MIPGKHCDFSSYLAKRPRAQSFACAEVQFPDYGTLLWALGSRNDSRKELRFQLLSCQESESSVGASAEVHFLIMEQSCGPFAVEMIQGKHCNFSTYI
jgi:hypothetical protein